MFLDAARFPFATALERSWREVLAEYRRVADRLAPWVERELYDGAWDVFPLFTFPHGEPIPSHVATCPHTAALVDAAFPRHGVAGFSVLRPRTRVKPHQGYQGEFLRCHLGLEIPPGDCGLRVAGETRRWEPGRVIVFDDRRTHEAWNETDAERVVLLVDFVPEGGGP